MNDFGRTFTMIIHCRRYTSAAVTEAVSTDEEGRVYQERPLCNRKHKASREIPQTVAWT